MRAKVLIISKDPAIKNLRDTLEAEGHHILEVDNIDHGLDVVNKERPDLLFLDAREFPVEETVIKAREIHPDTEFILITSLADEGKIMKKKQLDIFNFLVPPFTPDQIRLVTSRAMRQTKLARENRQLMAAISAAKAEWEATVDAIEDPIFIIDFQHNIRRANLAFFRKVGKGVAEVIGKKCFEVLKDFSESTACSLCAKVRESGSSVSEDVDFRNLDGQYHVTAYPLIYSGGGGFAVYMRKK